MGDRKTPSDVNLICFDFDLVGTGQLFRQPCSQGPLSRGRGMTTGPRLLYCIHPCVTSNFCGQNNLVSKRGKMRDPGNEVDEKMAKNIESTIDKLTPL